MLGLDGEVMDVGEISSPAGPAPSLTRTSLLSADLQDEDLSCGRLREGRARRSDCEPRTPGGWRAGARCPRGSPAARPGRTPRCSRRRAGSWQTWPARAVAAAGELAGRAGGRGGSEGAGWGRTGGTSGRPSTAPSQACCLASAWRGTVRRGEAGGRRREPCSGWARRTTGSDSWSWSSRKPTGSWWGGRSS